MAGTFTNNFNFVMMSSGDNVGTWGTTGAGGEPGLNSGIFSPLDSILGGSYAITGMSSGNYAISLTNWLNGIFILSGNLIGPATVLLPISPNSVGSSTAVGGKFVVVNNTSGNFTVTVKTSATGSTGVNIPQTPPSFSGSGVTWGVALYSDTVNVSYQDYGVEGFAKASNGDPNGSLAGIAAGPVTNASLAYDYVNNILYVCTFTGPATGGPGVQAVWTNVVSSGLPVPEPEGRLTTVSNTPIITSDFVASGFTTIYYTSYNGSWSAIHNGTKVVPYLFSQMSLLLSASQAANGIYDIYLAYNGGTPVIGTGPSWSAGTSGSVTAGSCARGTGVGGSAINRDAISGLWVNTQSMSLIYNTGSGNNTITVSAGQGILLGSIFIDASAGQVSCYISWGQNRKYGVSNAYNSQEIIMLAGDNTVSWTYAGSGVFRQSNGSTGNKITTFCCLPQTQFDIDFRQSVTETPAGTTQIGIGWNSTTTPTGFNPSAGSASGGLALFFPAQLIQPPALGINNVNMLELGSLSGSLATFRGTNANMQMTVRYSA